MVRVPDWHVEGDGIQILSVLSHDPTKPIK